MVINNKLYTGLVLTYLLVSKNTVGFITNKQHNAYMYMHSYVYVQNNFQLIIQSKQYSCTCMRIYNRGNRKRFGKNDSENITINQNPALVIHLL